MTDNSADLMNDTWTRENLLPEQELPDPNQLIHDGRKRARTVQLGTSPFLKENNVESEIQFKEQCMRDGTVMYHGQIGYRDPDKTRRAYAEIHEKVTRRNSRIDRYGICLDWSMGYPANDRSGRPRGTGLILETPDEFQQITAMAPVAAHFGDFVLGMPAAVETTEAALLAGSTTIGNIGQYFTFRLPHWNDDVATTTATIKALALCAAQPVPILIHSNLDDGFAALFSDLSCALGAVLLERHVVETLMGCHLGHCYGHTFSNPVSRWAFQRALARLGGSPGTMVYGNTTSYDSNITENYAALAAYIEVDILAQNCLPSGHAINPVPVTEATRIPDIDEVIDANLFTHRLMRQTESKALLYDETPADKIADTLIEAGTRFYHRVLEAFTDRGIDCHNPLEMLLAMKRMGARRLEALYGPGPLDSHSPKSRLATVETPVIEELTVKSQEILRRVGSCADNFRQQPIRLCVATTDVHEYGKVLLEKVARELNIAVVDGGVSTDPDLLCGKAIAEQADAIAISTYNGIALGFLSRLKEEMSDKGVCIPVFIGGKLNQIPDDSNSSLPVDVSGDLASLGAIPCSTIDEMMTQLACLKGEI